MDKETRLDGSAEHDPLNEIVIDERFAAASQERTVEVVSNPHLNATVSTPHHLAPDLAGPNMLEQERDPLVGQLVDNYEILGLLGRGGFGTVYKAKDVKLQRFAALKFLRFPLDNDFRKQFEREAQVIANLGKHPSIVQIYSWGEHIGSQYFALEFLDTSLESQIKKTTEPLSVKQALEVVADCASALHYAHGQGVLHRDIKPANILLDGKTGRAKVCDFGLAKFNALATGTDTRTIAGSPPYMAPEQIVGKNLDARTDVYSLGVTLYEMLSRELPCTGSSQVEIMDKIRSRQTTPLRVYRPDLSDSILDIVKRATAFLPDDRFQSAQEMESAARAVIRSLETTGSADNVSTASRASRAGNRKRFRPQMLAAAGIAVILAIGAGITVPSLSPSRGSETERGVVWPTALADAREQIDAGEYAAAITYLEGYLETNESEDFAKYALGYARLLSNQLPEAQAAFSGVSDVALREEGLAAVKHAEMGENARASLETASADSPSAYPAVLLASLDVLNNHYDTAIQRLEKVDEQDLNFDWQRRRYSELMARAYYNNQDYQKAEQVLSKTGGSSDTMSATVNELVMTMAKRQMDDNRHAEVTKQIEQIKSLADQLKQGAASDESDDDEWTSRPFRVRISPASGNNCDLAIEQGLVDVFGDLMADALVSGDGVPIELVDRDYIGDVLYEQQLANLSKDVDRIQLQKLLGARLMIESEFKSVMGENFVWVKIIDTETTKFTKVESASFDRRTNAREWARDLGEKAREAIEKAYPVQGILTAGGSGPVLNVGENVGVTPGMRFAVHTSPGSEHRLANVTAVAANVGTSSSTVTLEPAGATIPSDGWYLQEIQ